MPIRVTKRKVIKKSRLLPHWQFGGSAYFITFCSLIGELPGPARELVL